MLIHTLPAAVAKSGRKYHKNETIQNWALLQKIREWDISQKRALLDVHA